MNTNFDWCLRGIVWYDYDGGMIVIHDIAIIIILFFVIVVLNGEYSMFVDCKK